MKKERLPLALLCVFLALCTLSLCAACTAENIDKPQSTITADPIVTITPFATQAPSNTTEATVVPQVSGAPNSTPLAPESFTFDDTLFIGDSRTDGLRQYGNIEGADFFCAVSMSVFNLFKTDVEFKDMGKIKLDAALGSRQYAKIYIMLGLNELGYDFGKLLEKFNEVLSKLHEAQPNAIIYIESVLHVDADRDETHEYENNTNVNKLNAELEKLANGTYMFYMDINPVFDDENGCLTEQYTRDGCHLSAKYYPMWVEWLKTSTPMP